MRLQVLLIILLLGHAVWNTVDAKQHQIGIDFYHFWAPAQAKAASAEPLGDLYSDQQAYAAVLNARADELWQQFGVPTQTVDDLHQGMKLPPPEDRAARERSSQLINRVVPRLPPKQRQAWDDEQRFLGANMRRRTVDLTAPPLQYALFAFLPADYDVATFVFGLLQALGFALGTTLLWRAGGGTWSAGLMCAMALMLVYAPYRTDLSVGNFNSIHLLFAALPFLVVCGPLRRAEDDRARVLWGGVAMGLLALYAMLKPNFALVGLGLVAHIACAIGWRPFLRATAIGTAAALVLAAWPCVYFGSFGVWTDWLAYIGSSGDKLAYDIGKFNTAFSLHMVAWYGGSAFLYGSLTTALVVGTMLYTLSLGGDGASFGARLRSGTARMLANPFAGPSIGLLITLVASPLIWGHYLVIAIIPLVWLTQRDARLGVAFWLGAITLLAISRSYMTFFILFSEGLRWVGFDVDPSTGQDHEELVRVLIALGWIPLWIAMMARVRGEDHAATPATAVAT